MTSPVRRFPDVQRVLVEYLATLAGEGHCGTETPPDLADKLPFIRVRRTGGGAGRISDYPYVDIDVFAGTYADGEPLAELVRQNLMGPPPPVAVLDRVICETGPRELPWADDDSIRRFGATYLITARRHTPPS